MCIRDSYEKELFSESQPSAVRTADSGNRSSGRMRRSNSGTAGAGQGLPPVSYTHLDVYKRQVADQVAKQVPWELNMTLDKALDQSKQLRERMESDPQVRSLMDMARKVEGMPRHASTHAAGVVITAKPVSEYVPLCLNGEAVATQYTTVSYTHLDVYKRQTQRCWFAARQGCP